MTTYRISAGYHDSILSQTGSLSGHESVQSALEALAAVLADSEDLATIEGDDGRVYVYRSREALDADNDGSSAAAVIFEDDVNWRHDVSGEG